MQASETGWLGSGLWRSRLGESCCYQSRQSGTCPQGHLEDLSRLSFSQMDAAVVADNGKEKATGDDEVSSGETCGAVEAAHNLLPKVILA